MPCDYPPLYPCVLKLLRWAHAGLRLPGAMTVPIFDAFDRQIHWPVLLLLKSPAIVADLVTATLLYLLGTLLKRPGGGLAAAAVYLFNPAIIYDGAYFGQTDTILVTLSVGMLLAYLCRKPATLGALMVVAPLFKMQAVFVLMVFCFAILVQWRGVWRVRIRRLIAGGGIALLAVIALAALTGNLAQFWRGYVGLVGKYPIVTVRAFNFWWLVCRPWHKPPFMHDFPKDNMLILGMISYRTLGFILFFTAMGVVLWRLWKVRADGYATALALAVGGWAFFNFPTEMHERYSVPAAGLTCMLVVWGYRWTIHAMLLGTSVMLNIADVAPCHFPPWPALAHAVNWFIWPERQWFWTTFAVLHVLAFALTLEALWRAANPKTAGVERVGFPVEIEQSNHNR